ncbi:MAG: glycosyltransferase family 4 protein [Thermoleophilia bacterium]|nr:glycosyltransferase family 4 protein [Thermoleophilia bacterium]
MRVAYDARMATWGGIGTYSLELLRALGTLSGEADVSLLVLRSPEDDFLESLPELAGASWRVVAGKPWSLRGSLEAGFAARNRADLYHVPHVTMPTGFRGPLVATVHDIRPLILPATMPGLHKRAAFRLAVNETVRRAAVVLADSRHTAATLYAHGFSPRRLQIVPLGVDPRFRPQPPGCSGRTPAIPPGTGAYPVDRRLQAPQERGDTGPGLLPAARRDPGAACPRAGGGDGSSRSAAVRALAADLLRHDGDRVVFPGYVAAADLPALYTDAVLYVFPSTFEGFGLPLLEAAACATPVVASISPPLPEVIGDAAAYFDPHDVDQLTATLRGLIEDPDRRRDLAARGRARSRCFRWETAAARTLEAYRGALSEEGRAAKRPERRR